MNISTMYSAIMENMFKVFKHINFFENLLYLQKDLTNYWSMRVRVCLFFNFKGSVLIGSSLSDKDISLNTRNCNLAYNLSITQIQFRYLIVCLSSG